MENHNQSFTATVNFLILILFLIFEILGKKGKRERQLGKKQKRTVLLSIFNN